MKWPRRRPERETGMSLVEVMVAMALFVVGSLSLLSILTSTLAGTFDNRARVTGAHLAASDIDQARSTDYYALTSQTDVKVVDGRQYTVVREVSVTMSAAGGPASCSASGSSRQLHKKISTRVETAFRSRSTRPVRADTLIKAPLFDPASPHGAISFRVVDRDASPLPGLSVSIPGTPARTTDANGCVFFDVAPAGNIPVTVVRSGWVTIAGDSNLTRSVAVAAGQVSADTLRIGPAVPISVTANVFDGSSAVAGYGWPLGLSGRLAAPDRPTVTNTVYPSQALSAGVPRTWNAYPSPGGYDAYVGPCSSVVHTDSEPATSPQVVLPLSPVTVKLLIPGSQDIKGRSKYVSVAWRSPAGPACAEAETLTYSVRTPDTCVHQCLVNVAVPPGTWRVTALGTGQDGSPDRYADVTVPVRTPSMVEIDVT